MRVSASIMAHPVRAEQVTELQEQLDRDIPVVWATNEIPSTDPRVRWVTGRAAWEEHDSSADWHMVIQDDAVPCQDLLTGLEVALKQLGHEGLVSAYAGTGRPDQRNVARAINSAEIQGHSWMSTWSLCWGVAIIAPVVTIPDMLAWCSHSKRRYLSYDMRIGRYYRDVVGWRTWYTYPSLVDHRDGMSLLGHGGKRRAHKFHSGSALDIPWGAHGGLDVTVPTEARSKAI